MGTMRLAVCALIVGISACSPFSGGAAYHCERDDQCTGGPGAGHCELTGFCSFDDPACASGQRYGSSSGTLSNVCVGDEPPPDAAIDASIDPDAPDAMIDAPAAIARDCKDALAHGVTTSGVIMIDPDGANTGNPPFNAYCDMVTAGGGWTLVWVYGFTDYANFMQGDNAVTPRPTWGVPTVGSPTPTSTTVPLSPTTTGALDFPQWPNLGADVLVTSDINHWVQCTPGTGSVVTKTNGSMTCTIVKVVAQMCTTTVPNRFGSDPSGLGLFAGAMPLNTYYFWEGETVGGNWPTHDPCGNNGTNQLTGVSNPHGQIYVRR